jgi:hypothetical protein
MSMAWTGPACQTLDAVTAQQAFIRNASITASLEDIGYGV